MDFDIDEFILGIEAHLKCASRNDSELFPLFKIEEDSLNLALACLQDIKAGRVMIPSEDLNNLIIHTRKRAFQIKEAKKLKMKGSIITELKKDDYEYQKTLIKKLYVAPKSHIAQLMESE